MKKSKKDIKKIRFTHTIAPARAIEFINYHSNISPDDLFDLLEYLCDSLMLTDSGNELKHDLWETFIKKPEDWHNKEIKKYNDIIKKRQSKQIKAGIARARKLGKVPGRPKTVGNQIDKIQSLFKKGFSKSKITKTLNISRSSVNRLLNTKGK
jgi:DNA-directed RNA polymerase specialized sigma subunit